MPNLGHKTMKTTNKKSFALLMTIIALSSFAYLSLSIIETNAITTKIDTIKYLHLQANIHLKYIKNFILTHTEDEILNLNLNCKDKRFDLTIIKKEINHKSIYHISLKTKDDSYISVYERIIK